MKHTSDLTRKMIAGMMKQNTGMAMCDSGGYPKYDENGNYIGSSNGYGRNYERLSRVNLDNTPYSTLRINQYGIKYSKSMYHFLCENLEYAVNWQRSFDSFATKQDKYDSWREIIEKWIEYREIKLKNSVESVYWSGNKVECINTYNGESVLDGVYQAWFTVIDNQEIVILQSHNGADVRGGYSSPRVFSPINGSDYLVMVADGYIYCSKDNDHNWTTDDSYNWYFQGTCGMDYDKFNLRKLELTDYKEFIESPDNQVLLSKEYHIDKSQLSIPGIEPSYDYNPLFPDYCIDNQVLFYNENDEGLCPICGGILLPG